MSQPDPVAERVTSLIKDGLGIAVPDRDTDLFADGVLDSLSFVNLLLLLEREFEVSIPLEELELDSFRTVGTIARLLEARAAAAADRRGARGGPA